MKKQLLAVAILTAGISSAQTWSENFSTSTPPALPTNWLQNNVDGKVVNAGLASFNFGTNAWVTNDISAETLPDAANHGKIVASTSWYTTAATSNDWLITPSFTVPVNGAISWDALAIDAGYRDGYLVKISTTGTLTTDFSTTLLTIPAEEATAWSTRGINLNTYAGQVVRIAFINNSNDMNMLLLDNINVIIPAPMDGKLASLTGFSRYNANTSVIGVFQNNGYTLANNATINYILNNSSVVTQTMTFSTGLGYGDISNFTFTGSAAFISGQNTLKVWVSQVNGVGETIHTNDTISTTFFHASQSTLRNALLEEFSSSTCPPCAQLNATFDPILNANTPNSGGRVNAIKNQVNWPSPGNDPSYNPHVKDRVTYYGITGAPTALMNGHDILSHDQAGIDAGKLEPAFANITATLTEVGGVINGMASITPFVTVSNPSQLTVHQVLLQGSYNYPGASTSQKNYYHVMRKMFPSATGSLVATVDGTPINVAFTHSSTITATTPLPGSYDFW